MAGLVDDAGPAACDKAARTRDHRGDPRLRLLPERLASIDGHPRRAVIADPDRRIVADPAGDDRVAGRRPARAARGDRERERILAAARQLREPPCVAVDRGPGDRPEARERVAHRDEAVADRNDVVRIALAGAVTGRTEPAVAT